MFSTLKVKTKEELHNLDEELDLFNEDDWNFLDVHCGENLEYFNDLRDEDFRKTTCKDMIYYTLITLGVCLVFLVSGLWLYSVTIGRHLISDEAVSITNDVTVSLQRIEEGTTVPDDVYIEISKTLSGYFNILNNGSDYSMLNSFCLNSSNFTDTEELYRSKMEYTFDKNDCYARSLKCFSKYITMSRVNEVLVKDGTYYAYVTLNYPDNDLLTEYFYTYSSDLTKYFNKCDITEQNIVRYILDTSDTYGVPTSDKEVCIELYSIDGSYLISDDSFVTNTCNSVYNHAVSQVIKNLGVSKAVEQYD